MPALNHRYKGRTIISVDGPLWHLVEYVRKSIVGDTNTPHPFARPDLEGIDDLYVTKRKSVNDPWGLLANLGPAVNSSAFELDPCLSEDELTLLFVSSRPGGSGNFDIWVTTRLTRDDLWDRPVNLGLVVNSSSDDQDPCLSKV